MDELLTVKQVAGQLQLHIMTVYKWISQGLLEVIRLPSSALRIEAEERNQCHAKKMSASR